MKRGRNAYSCLTQNTQSDSLDVKNGRYTVSRFQSIDGESKWTLPNGDVPLFDNMGVLPENDMVVIGEVNGSLYLVRAASRPRLICRFKSYQAYQSDEFMWIVGGGSRAEDSIIRSKGEYLIHIPTGKYQSCKEPPRMTKFGKRFELEDKEIEWQGGQFQVTDRNFSQEKKSLTSEDITDMRKESLENFLSDNVNLDIIRNSDYMDEVDLSETPRPIVREFYEMGNGDFPEDPDGEFEPPSQEQFALATYHKFRELSEGDAFREETKQAWIQRFKNAWASLVRDVHFSFMMFQEQKETEFFDETDFSVERDIEQGVDFLAKKNGVEYHINLFIDTNKSRSFLNQKKKYRHPDNNAVAVELPMKVYGNQKKSLETEGEELWLYSEEHVDALKELISSDKSKVRREGTLMCKKIGNAE